jgi:hypothetical protein
MIQLETNVIVFPYLLRRNMGTGCYGYPSNPTGVYEKVAGRDRQREKKGDPHL